MKIARITIAVIAMLGLISCGGADSDSAVSPAPSGVDPALWMQLKEALEKSIADNPRHGVSRVPSIPQSKVQDFVLSEYTETSVTFTWSFRSQGDFDQNGEVNAADLTPLGAFFGATGQDDNWIRARVADGDSNGELTVADITPIGVNFGNVTTGYLLENSSTPEVEESWTMVAAVPLAEGVLPSEGGFKQFSLQLDAPVWESSYRVRPYNGDPQAMPELGIPSDFQTTPAETVVRTTFGTWVHYPLTELSTTEQFYDLDAAALGGRPALIFYNQTTQEVSAAVAATPRPTSLSYWDIDVLESLRFGTSWGVSIAECAGVLMATTVGLGGNIAFHTYDGSGSWATHDAIPFGGPFYRYPALAEIEGKPAVLVAGSGPDDLYYLRSTAGVPTQSSDWVLTHVFSQDNGYTLDLSAGRPFTLTEAGGVPHIAFVISSAGDRRQRLGRALSATPSGAIDWFSYEIFPEQGYVDFESLNDLPMFMTASREFFTPTSAVHSSPANWSSYFPLSEFPSIDDAQLDIIAGLSTVAWRQGAIGMRIMQAQKVNASQNEWFVQDLQPMLPQSTLMRMGPGNDLPVIYAMTQTGDLNFCYSVP